MRAGRRLEHAGQPDLFGAQPTSLIEGLRYGQAFLSLAEEAALLRIVQSLPIKEMRYKEYTARRRGISFGGSYDFDNNRMKPGAPVPDMLQPLRDRAAAWLGVAPHQLAHMLIAEYQPGTPLGWHRDVPDHEDIVGVSLHGDAVMQFRPYKPGGLSSSDEGLVQFLVEPRSIYAMRGPARWDWQHSVAPTPGLRYSITMRTPSKRLASRPVAPVTAAPHMGGSASLAGRAEAGRDGQD